MTAAIPMARPKKVNWWYEHIVTWMLANPEKSLRECAADHNVTQPWLSTVIHSDAFRDYAGRRLKHHHSLVSADILERVEALGDLSLDVLTERIENQRDDVPLGLVRETADMALKAMGYGGRAGIDLRGAKNVQVALVDPVALAQARKRLRKVKAVEKAAEAEVPKDTEAAGKVPLALPSPA